jgi:hypothetical protein
VLLVVDNFHQKLEDPFGMLDDNANAPPQPSFLASNKLQLKSFGTTQTQYVWVSTIDTTAEHY